MNMRHDDSPEKEFADKAKELFDESVDGLDGAALSRLNQGRHAALAELESGRRSFRQWAPAAGVAATGVLALLLWNGAPQVEELTTPAVASDMEILLTEDSFEMLQDLEFYSWIDFENESDQGQEPANNVG